MMSALLNQCLGVSSKSLPRLLVSSGNSSRCLSTATSPLLFRMTQVAWAEPLKKKKKLDPMVARLREERKKKRIEKQIRRLEKSSRQLKPIDECQVPVGLVLEKEIRTRTNPHISEEEEFYRSRLLKQWSVYKRQQSVAEVYMLDSLQSSMNRALEELKKESKDLWLEAIQIDPMLIPFRAKGPVRTPPIKGYDSPDGEYFNETKKWD